MVEKGARVRCSWLHELLGVCACEKSGCRAGESLRWLLEKELCRFGAQCLDCGRGSRREGGWLGCRRVGGGDRAGRAELRAGSRLVLPPVSKWVVVPP